MKKLFSNLNLLIIFNMETIQFYIYLLDEHTTSPFIKKYRKVFLKSLYTRFKLIENLPEILDNCAICLERMNKINNFMNE